MLEFMEVYDRYTNYVLLCYIKLAKKELKKIKIKLRKGKKLTYHECYQLGQMDREILTIESELENVST